MTATKNIRNMAKLTKISYEDFLKNGKKPKLNPNVVDLPEKIRNDIFNLANKYGAVFYGTFVTASNIKTRKTADYDLYLPKKNLFKFLEKVMEKYPKTTLRLNRFGTWRLMINNKDIADIGVLSNVVKNKDGSYTITEAPLNLRSKEHPYMQYGKARGKTLKVEHLMKTNATLVNTLNYEHKQHRYAKDTYDLGVLNRNLVIKLFDEYQKNPTVKLKNHINKLVREIVLYSSTPKVKEARLELEKQLLKNKMVTFRLFDPKKNKELANLKRKLQNPNYDITKNAKAIEYFKPTKK